MCTSPANAPLADELTRVRHFSVSQREHGQASQEELLPQVLHRVILVLSRLTSVSFSTCASGRLITCLLVGNVEFIPECHSLVGLVRGCVDLPKGYRCSPGPL